MTALDWILGTLLRPAATFQRAQAELRLGYWWIIMYVITLEVVTAWYSPEVRANPDTQLSGVLLFVAIFMILLFDLQALLLMGVGRLFGWAVTWADALKVIGLSWSVILLEDVITIYPVLRGYEAVGLWLGGAMFLWYLFALYQGVRTASSLPRLKILLITLLASIPWRGGLLWWYFAAKGSP